MRLWSLHPKYLDAKRLVAVWREGLLAKAVLSGVTKGYTQHPQLHRFKEQPNPQASLNAYLWVIWQEAVTRHYKFDASKLAPRLPVLRIPVSTGQLLFEWEHLKLKQRSNNVNLQKDMFIENLCHPLFLPTMEHKLESWEKGKTVRVKQHE